MEFLNQNIVKLFIYIYYNFLIESNFAKDKVIFHVDAENCRDARDAKNMLLSFIGMYDDTGASKKLTQEAGSAPVDYQSEQKDDSPKKVVFGPQAHWNSKDIEQQQFFESLFVKKHK